MGRQPCCDKIGLKRGPWTVDEDQKLMNFILNNGIHCWRLVPKLAGLMRCGKSCRLRWTNYLRPDLKRRALTEMEENQIIQLHSRLGNRWSKIASHFPGRTDNEIKNHWNTRIKKRLKLLGVDPLTHKPIEPPENSEQKDDQMLPTYPCKNENELETKMSETTQMGDLVEPQMNKVVPDWELNNTSLLNNHGQLWKDLIEDLKPQANPCSSCSTSFSLEATAYHPYMGEACSSTLIEDSELYWSNSMDHASWFELHPLDDAFYFGNNQ